jgi:hypothetical protein
MPVGGQREYLFHVAETGERANQANMMHAAMFLQSHDLIRGQRAVSFADLRVAGKGKDVFDIKLQFVDLPVSQPFDQLLERLQRRNFAPGAIVIDPATIEIGRIFDLTARQNAS